MSYFLKHLLIFGPVFVLTGFLLIYFYPRLLLSNYKKAILIRGGGDGPIPVNMLYTESQEIFADPLHPPASASKLMTTGVNHDTLLTIGWLNLSREPQVLHVPEMGSRYYSVQFTDPTHGINFAYVGTRTTGSKAGDYLISGPDWKGIIPQGLMQIASPNNEVLVTGRTLVADDKDLTAAHALAEKIQLRPFSRW